MLARRVEHLRVADVVHQLEPLQRLLDRDADKRLRQRAGPVRAAEEEQAAVTGHTKQRRDIFVVRQRCREAHHAHMLHRGLDLTQRPAQLTQNICGSQALQYLGVYR